MTTPRHFVYRTLTTTPDLVALIGGDDPRVFAKKSMTSSQEQHPYLVYKLGYAANQDLSEDTDVERQFIQIWVHDYTDGDTADYDEIDKVIVEIKKAFRLASSAEDRVMIARYLETSQDLNDDTLNTVFKYVRFQLVTEDLA